MARSATHVSTILSAGLKPTAIPVANVTLDPPVTMVFIANRGLFRNGLERTLSKIRHAQRLGSHQWAIEAREPPMFHTA